MAFEFTPPPGDCSGSVAVEDENIPGDNRAKFSFRVAETLKIALVRGTGGSSDPFYFLRYALDPDGDGRFGVRFEELSPAELGSADLVINLLSPQDIADLEQLVENEERFGDPYLTGFHRKLYENMGNKMMTEFQTLIIPVLEYVVEQHKPMFETRRAELAAKGKLVTHRDLLERIKAGDTEGYKEALKHHFDLYKDYLKRTRTDAEGLIREIIEAAL